MPLSSGTTALPTSHHSFCPHHASSPPIILLTFPLFCGCADAPATQTSPSRRGMGATGLMKGLGCHRAQVDSTALRELVRKHGVRTCMRLRRRRQAGGRGWQGSCNRARAAAAARARTAGAQCDCRWLGLFSHTTFYIAFAFTRIYAHLRAKEGTVVVTREQRATEGGEGMRYSRRCEVSRGSTATHAVDKRDSFRRRLGKAIQRGRGPPRQAGGTEAAGTGGKACGRIWSKQRRRLREREQPRGKCEGARECWSEGVITRRSALRVSCAAGRAGRARLLRRC